MSNPGFTRDEAILALDTLYCICNGTISATSDEMQELSTLLKRLPIHPKGRNDGNFRSCTGVTKQLKLFQSNCKSGCHNEDVGSIFFKVAFEYENRLDELHEIAQAIRRNEDSFAILQGDTKEDRGFPEGILLGHLHCVIEKRDSRRLPLADRCEICKCTPELYYGACGALLQHHLVIPPEQLDGKKKYGADCFITVCPNCHEALHRYRPWLIRENCGDLLR